MDRVDWYFRQLVTEGEMDFAFDQVQDRIEQAASQAEMEFDGMISGGDVTAAGVPDLTVDVGGDGFGYTPEGKRLSWPSGETNVDVSEDDFAVSTEVTTPGNARWISVFVEFDEAFDDLRTDGFGSPVYWKRLGSYRFFVVMSDEDVTPTRPPLRSDALLLADIYRLYGQTTIQNTDIDVSRREDYFRSEGNFRSDIVRGTAKDTLYDILAGFNLFASDLDNNSPYPAGASLVGIANYTGSSPPNGTDLGFLFDTTVEDGLRELIDQLVESSPESGANRIGIGAPNSWLVEEDVHSVISELVFGLGSTVSAESGATRIGIEATNSTPTGGLPCGIGSDEELWTALDGFFSELAATGATINGGRRIGVGVQTGAIVALPSPATLAQGSVFAQLKQLIDYIETIRNTPFVASAVGFTPHDYITSTNVQAAINELVDDLQSTTGAAGSGAREIGYEGSPVSGASSASPAYGVTARRLYQVIDRVYEELAKRAALFGNQIPFANRVAFGDTNFWLELTSPDSDPAINLDVGDYLLMDRSEGRLKIFNDTNELCDFRASGLKLQDALGIAIGPPGIGCSPYKISIATGGASGMTQLENALFDGYLQQGNIPHRTRLHLYANNATTTWWMGFEFDDVEEMYLDSTLLRPGVSGGLDLGSTSFKWQDVYAFSYYARTGRNQPTSQLQLTEYQYNAKPVVYGRVSAVGTLSPNHFNISNVVAPIAGAFTINLDQAVHIDSAIIVTAAENANDRVGSAVFNSATQIEVQMRDSSSGAGINTAFTIVVIGRANSVVW